MVAIPGGYYFNPAVRPPHYITGNSYLPPPFTQMTGNTNTLTVTATRIYYTPFPIWENRTFAGAQTFNAGAGDNGKKIRLGIYNDDGAAGGPGTLAKDFGEITLTGAAALRTLSSSWSAAKGMYWSAWQSDTNPSMNGMSFTTYQSAAGQMAGRYDLSAEIGTITPAGGGTIVHGLYVDTTYGAFASTAVAATAANTNNAPETTKTPLFFLKA